MVSPKYADPATWNCDPANSEPAGGDWTVLIEIADNAPTPGVLYTRLGHFDRLDLAVRDETGRWAYATRTMQDVETVIGTPHIYTPLPTTDSQAVLVLAAFRGNGHGPTLNHAQVLPSQPVLTNNDIITLLMLAALIGVLLIPIALDAAFLSVMREPFLGWHIALSIGFAGMIATRSNMIGLAIPVSAETLRIGMIMSMGIVIAIALMFTRSYVEPGKLSPLLQRVIPMVAAWTLLVSAVHAASFEALRPMGGNLHSFGMAVPMVVLGWALVSAARNGSRAVRFQLFGWTPMFLAALIQLATHVLPFGLQQDAISVFHIGILFEGIGTAMGVADRFILIRRERDKALNAAKEMTRLSVHDPLTGLLNRRAVEKRFDELREEGFHTFALIDLDRFKQINDKHGHQVGDAALVACAKAIEAGDDRETIAVRLGGEEFVVLLKGEDTRRRVEALREAIPTRIMNDVPGLDMPVTASVGMVELPSEAPVTMSFKQLYARADQLLYEAKAAGRNRMVYERLILFAAKPDKNADTGSVQAA